MLHIAKLAVGIRSVEQLGATQMERTSRGISLRHRTRHAPKRRDELVVGGSLYWVVAGSMVVRQRILDVVHDRHDDGSPAAAFILHPELVGTDPRPTRPFQGWRYLSADSAPADVSAFSEHSDLHAELRSLCLI